MELKQQNFHSAKEKLVNLARFKTDLMKLQNIKTKLPLPTCVHMVFSITYRGQCEQKDKVGLLCENEDFNVTRNGNI